MSLENATLQRMVECFGGRVCCKCRQPAERLHHNSFYCARHFPRGTWREPTPKVYKVLIGTSGRPAWPHSVV
jgi:hypothetical protein